MKSASRLVVSCYFIVAIVVVGYLLVPISGARAATGLTIQPVKVSHTLQPGESVSGVIRLSSASDGEPVQIEANVEDFIPVAGADGIKFVGRAPGVTTVRDWITLGSDKTFTLRQGEQAQISYTITAPANAEPGSHFGVAFFKATRPALEGVEQLSIGTRIGMLILVTVPGNHLQKGKILDFSGPDFVQRPPVDFSMKFENTGTVHFEPKGTLTLRNMFGQDVGKVPIEGQVVLPTGMRDINVSWNVKGWLLGRYLATATVFDGEGEALTTDTLSFWVVPVWYILSFIIAVLLVFFVLRWLKRRVKILRVVEMKNLAVLMFLGVIISWPLMSSAALITTQSGVNLTVTIPGDSEPEPDPGSGGGGGGGGGGGVDSPTGVVMSGRAYPLSKVSVLKDGQLAASTIAGPDSKFSISLTNVSSGNHTFAIYGEDSSGRRSQTFSFPVFVTNGASTNISGIFISPTIAADKAQVRRGDNIAIFGQSTPNGQITIEVNSENQLFVNTQADAGGVYLYNLNSAPLEIGQHLTRSKASIANEVSEFGQSLVFAVGTINIPATTTQTCPAKADLNQDCRVNLVDFSIAAFWYKRPLGAAFRILEQNVLNNDGVVDLKDFSIMAYYWTG